MPRLAQRSPSRAATADAAGPIRVLQVIARMNLGGPAYHVALLSGRLPAGEYETIVVTGCVGPGEMLADDIAARYGSVVRTLATLSPELDPRADLRAVGALIRTIRRFRPDIVHTHTAKAGAVGRLAAWLSGRPRPLVVHTYHGHVLTGYFGPAKSWVYRTLEKGLARCSDCLIGVSAATVDELVALRVAPRERFRVVMLGHELDEFLEVPPAPRRTPEGAALRAELGVADNEIVATFVGRLVAIKRVDVALDAVARARAEGAPVRLVVVGDGELRGELERRAGAPDLQGAVSFLGYRRDLAAIASATDIALLSSDNEGTPVALIEAAAAGRPAVATAVGGVPEIVNAATGRLVAPGDPQAMATALAQLSGDAGLRAALGGAARADVGDRWTVERLIQDADALYKQLLSARRS